MASDFVNFCSEVPIALRYLVVSRDTSFHFRFSTYGFLPLRGLTTAPLRSGTVMASGLTNGRTPMKRWEPPLHQYGVTKLLRFWSVEPETLELTDL